MQITNYSEVLLRRTELQKIRNSNGLISHAKMLIPQLSVSSDLTW